jgi:hypothetical protein
MGLKSMTTIIMALPFRTMFMGTYLVGAGPCVINVGTFERLNVGTFNMPALFLGKHRG